VLAGSSAFIVEAWRVRQQFGGGLRQAGIVAAGGLHALDHHVDRLAEDHANARRLANGLDGLPGLEIDSSSVETNIVFVRVVGARSADEIVAELSALGIRVSAVGDRIRAVTHLDVDEAAVDQAVRAFADVMGGSAG
jgi:threonine aldolase